MAHLITSDDYRFGRSHGKRAGVRTRGALRRVSGFLKNMIEAIADSKMRRIERELDCVASTTIDSTTIGWRAILAEPFARIDRPRRAPVGRRSISWRITCANFRRPHPLLVPCFGRPPAPSGRF
jgi:hypothetical protein